MKITYRGDYALKTILDLALHHGELVHIENIAERQDIPIKFLEQILLTLKNGGFVRSKRGPGGGYTLTRPPTEITVGEVIRFIEGPIEPIACVEEGYDGCDFPDRCAFRDLFAQVSSAVSRIIDRVTFEDMKQNTLKKETEHTQSYVYHI